MLQPLFPPKAIAPQDREANIVIVPGVGTPSPSVWRDSSGNWLEKLLQDCSMRIQMWTYEYTIGSLDKPIVKQLVDEGQKLLACLDDLCKKDDTTKRKPLFFICHSLGGIILKQALSLTKDHVYRYLNIIEVISGMVFLGTPHLSTSTGARPNVLENILRLRQKTLPRRDALTPDDNMIMARLCHNFELIGIQVPVVSAYETVESRIYEGMFAKFRRPHQVVIVPKEHGIIGSRNEFIFGASLDHDDISKVQVNGVLYKSLRDTLESALSDARSLISEKFHASSHDWNYTMRSQTTEDPRTRAMPEAGPASQGVPMDIKKPNTSAEATFGSSAAHSHDSKTVTNFESLRRNPRLPCFSVGTHKRNDEFFGREDVFELIDKSLLRKSEDATSLDRSSVRSFALCGMGGLGKTQIAVEYAYSRRQDFDAILWVTADDANLLSQEFAQVAVDLGLREEGEMQDLTVAREHVKGWLSNPVRSHDAPSSPDNEVSWLLIFDNADNFEVIEEYWPTTGFGAVLTTSRDPLAKNHIFTADQGIDLQPLSIPDSVQFMTNLTRRHMKTAQVGKHQDIVEIVKNLGGLPLLITQMAGVMARLRLSYSDFLVLYRETGLEAVNRTGGMETVPRQLYSISFRLGLDGLAPRSLGLLNLISMLDPDRIPEKILTGLCTSSSQDQLQVPTNLGQYFEARAQLLQTSLIKQNAETRDIWVHRIVQDVARDKLGQEQTATVYKAAIQAVSIAWPFSRLETRFNTGRYKECATVFPNVLRLKNAYGNMSGSGAFKHDLATAKLFSDAGWYWFERGLQEESREWFQLVQDICNRLEDRSTEEAAYVIRETHHNQGTAAGETNDKKDFLTHAKVWLEMMLERKNEKGQPIVDYELGIGYNEVGVAYAMNGDYVVALSHFIKAIDTFQALPNYDDTMLGWTESNIGLMYWMLGNYDDAERALLEIIAIYKAAYGEDDTLSFKTGKMLYALGNVYVSQGRYVEGLNLHTRCLKQYRATLGDTHHRIGDACVRLADDNIRFQNYAEAQALIDQALKVFSGRPRYKQEYARALYKAGQLSQAVGNSARATLEFEEAYRLRQGLVRDDQRGIEELQESDFDDLVVFWSR